MGKVGAELSITVIVKLLKGRHSKVSKRLNTEFSGRTKNHILKSVLSIVDEFPIICTASSEMFQTFLKSRLSEAHKLDEGPIRIVR